MAVGSGVSQRRRLTRWACGVGSEGCHNGPVKTPIGHTNFDVVHASWDFPTTILGSFGRHLSEWSAFGVNLRCIEVPRPAHGRFVLSNPVGLGG